MSAATRADSRVPVRSVARALDILVALEDGSQTLGSLARTARLSKATAHRLLASLSTGGLVVQDPATSTYMLGPGCFGILDAVVLGSGGLDVIAGPILNRLAEATGESIAMHVRIGPSRICVAQIPSTQPVRYVAHVGVQAPIYAGASGKVLLAFSDPQQRREILTHLPQFVASEENTINRADLDRQLEVIRRAGYGLSRGERTAGVAAVSAPVFGSDGRVLAALSIVGPEERLTDGVLAGMRPLLLAAASDITARIAANRGPGAGTDGTDGDEDDD